MSDKDLYCSFCGKSHRDVIKLIVGPDNVSICNECVSLCDDIIEEENKPPEAAVAENALVKQAREWLAQTHWSEQQKLCDKRCHDFDALVDAGRYDQDPRILGYVDGLKSAAEKGVKHD